MSLFRRKAAAAEPETDRPVRDGVGYRLMQGPARWLAALAGRFGAERAACETILLTRLRLDMRTGGLKNPNKPESGGLLLTCIMYFAQGLLVGLLVGLSPLDATRAMGLVQAVLLISLGVLLVSDYLNLLIDPAEADVVASRPVTGRTLLLARLAHLLLYLVLPLGCFLLPVWVCGIGRPDRLAWLLLLPVVSLLAVLLCLSVVLLVFVALLQRLDGDRLQNVLVRSQIVASLLLFGGYYLFIGLGSNPASRAWLESDSALQLLLPPYWFGAAYAVTVGRADALGWALAALGTLSPLLAFVLLLRRTGPQLVTGLASLRRGGGDTPQGRPGPLRRLAGRLVAPGLERAGFDVFIALAARERGFRSRVYPLLALPFVMLAWTALDPRQADSGIQAVMWGSLIPLLYALIILNQLKFSDTPEASWLFASAPMEAPGLFVSGVVKALAFTFLLPWIVLVTLASVLMAQEQSLSKVAFGTTFAVFVLLAMTPRLTSGNFPFSRGFAPRQGNQTALLLIGLFGISVLGVLQALLAELDWGLEFATLVQLPLLVWLARRLRRLKVDPQAIPEPR